MATWKDGPEYAPTHRPEGFATPAADPLDAAPPVERTTPGAVPPPAHFQDVQAPPLKEIGTEPPPSRSPREPFDVTTATMTSVATLPDGTRDPRTAFNVAASTMTAPPQPPPPPPDAQPIGHGPTPPAPAPPPSPAPPAPSAPQPQPPAQRQKYQPARQWEPDTHEWRPAPQSQPSPDERTRPLVHLVTGMAFVGMLLPAAAPVLLTIAGIIASGRIPKLREIGFFTAALGGIVLLVQFFLRDPGLEAMYSLAAFGALVAFLIRGYIQKPR